MRKVILSMNMTLDGFMSGPEGELDWHFTCWNEEMAMAAAGQLEDADTILLGRRTYEAMASYWSSHAGSSSAPGDESGFAGMMNRCRKIVFSRSPKKDTRTPKGEAWNNSRLVKNGMVEEINRLKLEPGKDMIVYGSGELVSSLMREGLVDEYRIWVHPIILGKGRPLFGALPGRIGLELFGRQVFRSGVVILYYKPQSNHIMKKEMLAEIESTESDFVETLSSFSPGQINEVPFEGSWTAGQVAEHVIKSVSGVAYAVRGKVKPADRAADEKIAPIREMFLDFSTKMKAPEFTLPGGGPYRKEQLIGEFRKAMASITSTIQGSDLSEICLEFEFPGFGFLTRTEWIHFVLVHTQRHIHQLKKILTVFHPEGVAQPGRQIAG